MSLPAAVRKAAEKADQMVKDVQEGRNPAPAAAPAQPAQPAQPQPAPRSDANPNPQEGDAAYWQQRFNVINGKYNAEVPELHRQLRATQERIAEIEREKQIVAATRPRLTDEDRKEWGDTIEVMQRASEDAHAAKLAAMQAEIDRLKGLLESLGGTVTKVTGETYFQRMDRELPEWRQINVHDAFLAWLAVPDEISGVPRMDHLQQHHAAQNADAVLKVFRAFLKEQPNAVQIAKQPTPENPGAAAYIAPTGSSGSGGAPGSDGKPRYTLGQITGLQKQVSTDLALGRYRGREDEASRLLQEYDAAYLEGRVNPG